MDLTEVFEGPWATFVLRRSHRTISSNGVFGANTRNTRKLGKRRVSLTESSMKNHISISSHGDELISANSGRASFWPRWAESVPHNLRDFQNHGDELFFISNFEIQGPDFCLVMIKPQYRTDEPSVRLTAMPKAMVQSPSEGVEVSIKAGAETDKIGSIRNGYGDLCQLLWINSSPSTRSYIPATTWNIAA